MSETEVLLSRQLEADWGLGYKFGYLIKKNEDGEIEEELTLLDPGGPLRRRAPDELLIPDIPVFSRFRQTIILKDDEYWEDRGKNPNNSRDFGSTFLVAGPESLAVRIRISPPGGVQFYVYQYENQGDQEMRNVMSVLLNGEVNVKAVRDNAHYSPRQLALATHIVRSRLISVDHEEYFCKMDNFMREEARNMD